MQKRVVLLVLAAIGGAVAVAGWFFSKPQDGTAEEIVLLCTGGTRHASDFGVTAGVTDSALQLKAVMQTQFNQAARPSDSPEATRQQFQYLACIDKRVEERIAARSASAPSVESECTSKAPCVDLVRIADFSKSGCGPPRIDEARFEDTVTVTPTTETDYLAAAEPSGTPGLRVTRIDAGSELEIPVTQGNSGASDERYKTAHYSIPLVNGKGTYYWNWTNGHSDDHEGLIFTRGHRVRSIYAKLVLPPDVNITSDALPSGCTLGTNNLVCRHLDPDIHDKLQWWWTWNMKRRCQASASAPAPNSSGSAAAVSQASSTSAGPAASAVGPR